MNDWIGKSSSLIFPSNFKVLEESVWLACVRSMSIPQRRTGHLDFLPTKSTYNGKEEIPPRRERRVLVGKSHNFSRWENIQCPLATLWERRHGSLLYILFPKSISGLDWKSNKISERRCFTESLPLHQNPPRFYLKLDCFIFTFPELLLTYSSHSAVYVVTLRAVLLTMNLSQCS